MQRTRPEGKKKVFLSLTETEHRALTEAMARTGQSRQQFLRHAVIRRLVDTLLDTSDRHFFPTVPKETSEQYAVSQSAGAYTLHGEGPDNGQVR